MEGRNLVHQKRPVTCVSRKGEVLQGGKYIGMEKGDSIVTDVGENVVVVCNQRPCG